MAGNATVTTDASYATKEKAMGLFKSTEQATEDLWASEDGSHVRIYQVGTVTAVSLLANYAGDQGWELMQVVPGFSVGLSKTDMGYTLVFKRVRYGSN